MNATSRIERRRSWLARSGGIMLSALVGGWICMLPPAAPANERVAVDSTSDALMSNADSARQATIAEFQTALDSVYVGIAGTYYGIQPILKHSCYDCHSDQTDYPWYHVLPGISGMIDHDIEEGREHLDMSNGFPFGGKAHQLKQLAEIKEEIEKGAMPMQWYRWMHWGTAVEGARRDSLFDWVDQSSAAIESVHVQYGMPLPGKKKQQQGE